MATRLYACAAASVVFCVASLSAESNIERWRGNRRLETPAPVQPIEQANVLPSKTPSQDSLLDQATLHQVANWLRTQLHTSAGECLSLCQAIHSASSHLWNGILAQEGLRPGPGQQQESALLPPGPVVTPSSKATSNQEAAPASVPPPVSASSSIRNDSVLLTVAALAGPLLCLFCLMGVLRRLRSPWKVQLVPPPSPDKTAYAVARLAATESAEQIEPSTLSSTLLVTPIAYLDISRAELPLDS